MFIIFVRLNREQRTQDNVEHEPKELFLNEQKWQTNIYCVILNPEGTTVFLGCL